MLAVQTTKTAGFSFCINGLGMIFGRVYARQKRPFAAF